MIKFYMFIKDDQFVDDCTNVDFACPVKTTTSTTTTSTTTRSTTTTSESIVTQTATSVQVSTTTTSGAASICSSIGITFIMTLLCFSGLKLY